MKKEKFIAKRSGKYFVLRGVDSYWTTRRYMASRFDTELSARYYCIRFGTRGEVDTERIVE